MSPFAWLAIGAAIMVAPTASPLPGRMTGLATAGRLVSGTPAARPPAWRRLKIALDEPAAVAIAAATAGCVAAARGVALAVAAVTVVTTVGQLIRVAARRRRTGRERDELIIALRLLVAELRAGSRPAAALRAAADLGPAHAAGLASAASAVESGAEWVPAVPPPLQPLARAWRVAEVTGAPIADVLARVVVDLEDARDSAQQVAAALAGPRSSAVLLAGLPVLGLALGVAMGADPMQVLIGTGVGRLLCAVGALLEAVGVAWTMRIAARAERAGTAP